MQYVQPPGAGNAAGFIDILHACLRGAGCRWNAPEWLATASGADMAAYTASLTAHAPFVRNATQKQKTYKQAYTLVIKQAIQTAIDYGRLPRETFRIIDIQCEAPSIPIKSEMDEAQANKIRVEGGWKSRQTVQQEEGLDPQREMQNMEEYNRRVGNGQQAGPVQMQEANFNPDEPRDERGRWTKGSGGKIEPSHPTAAPASKGVPSADELRSIFVRPVPSTTTILPANPGRNQSTTQPLPNAIGLNSPTQYALFSAPVQAAGRQEDQKAKAQQTAIQGVPKAPVQDLAGPDVTNWFARDIVDQIKYRATAQQKLRAIYNVQENAAQLYLQQDLLSFKDQAAYLLAAKWMNFGSPADGQGVNTVVVAGRVLRKNQLGNIEFGLLSEVLPPALPENPIRYAYQGEGGSADKVSTYWKDHPYADTFGAFKGVARADNLAAFGVGHGIADEINKLPIMKQIRERALSGKPILSKEEEEQLTKDVNRIVGDLLKNPDALARRVNKYNAYLKEKLGSKADVRIPTEALTFVPNKDGGFNTESLSASEKPSPYEGPSSREYFQTELKPAYDRYATREKTNGRRPLNLDQWLQVYHENYSVAKQKQQ